MKATGTKPNITQLLHNIGAGKLLPRMHLIFGVWSQSGASIRGDKERVSLCCDLYNARNEIAEGLRLRQALLAHPDQRIKLEVGGCTCQTKSHETKYHAQDCVYAAVAELGGGQ